MSTAKRIIQHGTASVPAQPTPGPGKHIQRDPITGDWAAYYDGELLGYRKRRDQAQTLADQHVYDLFRHDQPVTAGELAAGAE
jgi:hypothetical protein